MKRSEYFTESEVAGMIRDYTDRKFDVLDANGYEVRSHRVSDEGRVIRLILSLESAEGDPVQGHREVFNPPLDQAAAKEARGVAAGHGRVTARELISMLLEFDNLDNPIDLPTVYNMVMPPVETLRFSVDETRMSVGDVCTEINKRCRAVFGDGEVDYWFGGGATAAEMRKPFPSEYHRLVCFPCEGGAEGFYVHVSATQGCDESHEGFIDDVLIAKFNTWQKAATVSNYVIEVLGRGY